MTGIVNSFFSPIGLDFTLLDRTGSKIEVPHLSYLMSSYNHTIDSFGGFTSAKLILNIPSRDAEWWYEQSLGFQIKITGNAGQPVWEGFSNVVTLSAGGDSEVRGPLLDIGNLISTAYSPMNYSVVPPVAGSEVLLAPSMDTTSQARYGIWEKVISAGQCSDAMAAWSQAVSIADLPYPKVSGSVNLGGRNKLTIQLDCLGKVYYLFAYIYNNVAGGDVTLTAKILAILAADPNGLLSTNYSQIASNTQLVGAAEGGNRYALDIIKENVALGNSTTNARMLFGVYDNGQVYYKDIPTTIEYRHNLTWNDQSIQSTLSNSMIPPWLVRPGKWLIVPDFLVRVPPGLPLNRDPRVKFLESVKYTAPWTIDLSGGKTDRLSQLLAQITYSQGSSGGG